MDINQLRCFVVLGDELHFGRAARKLEMMPASLSRFIKLLEDDLGMINGYIIANHIYSN